MKALMIHFVNFRLKIQIVDARKSSLGYHHCMTKILQQKNHGWNSPNEGMIFRKVLSTLKKNTEEKNGFQFFHGATNGLIHPDLVPAGFLRQQNVYFRVCSKKIVVCF